MLRNPENSSTFYLSAEIAPALVSKPADIVEYRVVDAQPVDPNAPPGYIERYIHSEILKRFPSVNSVIHSHSYQVIPFTILNDAPLKPISIPGYIVGTGLPNFDPETVYNATQSRDLLIRDPRLGAALAKLLSDSPINKTLLHAGVLQRGHGFSMTGGTIEMAVYNAIFTQISAQMQATAMQLASDGGVYSTIRYLSTREWMAGQQTTSDVTSSRAWTLWSAEVERAAGTLYRNSLQNWTKLDVEG